MKRKLVISLVFSLIFILCSAMFLCGCFEDNSLKDHQWNSALYLDKSSSYTLNHTGTLYDQKDGTALRSFNEQIMITENACKLYQSTTELSTNDVTEQEYYYDRDCGTWYLYEKQQDGTYLDTKVNNPALMAPYQWFESYISIYKNQFNNFRKVDDHYNMSSGNNSVDVYIDTINNNTQSGTLVSYRLNKIDMKLDSANNQYPDVHYQVSTIAVQKGSTVVSFPENMLIDRKEYCGYYVAINKMVSDNGYQSGYEDRITLNGDYPLVYVLEDKILFGGNGNLNLISLPYTVVRQGQKYIFNVDSDIITDVEFLPGYANSNGFRNRNVYAYHEGNTDTIKYKVEGVEYYAYVTNDFDNVNIIATDNGDETFTPVSLVYISNQTGIYGSDSFYLDCMGMNCVIQAYGSRIIDETTAKREVAPKVYIAQSIKICEVEDFNCNLPNGVDYISYNARTNTITNTNSNIDLQFNYDSNRYERLKVGDDALFGRINCFDKEAIHSYSINISCTIYQVSTQGIITTYKVVENSWQIGD